MDSHFFTITDSRFFVGTVALLNSLRLTGHTQELVVLDCGLTENQRGALELGGAALVAPPDPGVHPLLLKPFPATLRQGAIAVVIDSDMVVTSSLEPIIARAAEGEICVFPDHWSDLERWFAEWQDLFELREPLRRQPYANAGFIAFSSGHWPWLMGRWQELCSEIPAQRARLGNPGSLAQLDQDAMNALLMSEVPAGAVHQLPSYEWDLRRVVVKDAATLACVADGRSQPLLHAALNPKVWQPEGWRRVEDMAAYVRLLPRLLFDPDVQIRLDPNDVPLWVRPGLRSRAVVRAVGAYTKLPIVLLRARRAPRRLAREARRALASMRRVRPGTGT